MVIKQILNKILTFYLPTCEEKNQTKKQTSISSVSDEREDEKKIINL